LPEVLSTIRPFDDGQEYSTRAKASEMLLRSTADPRFAFKTDSFTNLLSNAVKFHSEKEGALAFTVSRNEDSVSIGRFPDNRHRYSAGRSGARFSKSFRQVEGKRRSWGAPVWDLLSPGVLVETNKAEKICLESRVGEGSRFYVLVLARLGAEMAIAPPRTVHGQPPVRSMYWTGDDSKAVWCSLWTMNSPPRETAWQSLPEFGLPDCDGPNREWEALEKARELRPGPRFTLDVC